MTSLESHSLARKMIRLAYRTYGLGHQLLSDIAMLKPRSLVEAPKALIVLTPRLYDLHGYSSG